jgi:hypothetical protein
LHGRWHGQLSAAKGESTDVLLKVGTDKAGKQVFEMAGAKSLRMGAMTELTGEHHKLRWRQEISGKSCEAMADVAAARPETPDTLKGTIACGQDQFNFQLTKTHSLRQFKAAISWAFSQERPKTRFTRHRRTLGRIH